MEQLFILFIFSILLFGIIYFIPKGNGIISDSGYIVGQPNPYYFSGNKQQRVKKHNMLRISKLRRKK